MEEILKHQENLSNENKIENIKYDFPRGTTYEKELMTNFKYFNIFWYEPNKTNNFDFFKNCFKNTRLVKGINLESAIDFFKKEQLYDEWIVITPGSKGEELIKNLEQNKLIFCFFIYCKNVEYHEKWATKIKKVKCLTSNPEIICKKLIELNKDYLFPNFNYGKNARKEKNNDDYLFLWNIKKLKSENEFALNSVKNEIKQAVDFINKTKNIYSKFCIKSINYLNSGNCLKDIKETIPNETTYFNLLALIYREKPEEEIEDLIKRIKYYILLSFYFNEYEYLLNLLSNEEIKELFKEKKEFKLEIETGTVLIIEKLIEKILKNESIIDLKDELKEIQKFFILFIISAILEIEYKDIYGVVNALKDFGFCSKIFVQTVVMLFDNKNHIFSEELMSSSFVDFMHDNFLKDTSTEENDNLFSNNLVNKENSDKKLSDEDSLKINDLLSKKNLIIIGKNDFIEKFKIIEKDLKIESIKYLQIQDISNYIKEKNKSDHKKNKIRIFFYYLIITYDEFVEYFERIIILSAEFGLTFLILVYIEKDNLLISKSYIKYLNIISIIYFYSIEDILKYFSNTKYEVLNCYNYYCVGFSKNLNLIKPSESKNYILDCEDDYQDGCFELAETFNYKIVENKTILYIEEFGSLFYSLISDDIYNIYKDHNALDLFLNQIIKYFRFCLKDEMISLDICLIKRILYLYCREEKEHEKSFYRMINDDLRTKEPSKVDRLIYLLSIINRFIEKKELASFNGKVYRATKLDENLILKLKTGSKMINTTFWSTSKNLSIAENFMRKNTWRNAYIICKTIKTNIDIDYEKLNPYNEYEVLILPFTEFRVEKIYLENKFNKKIYIIELIELGNKNFVNFENMNTEKFSYFTYVKSIIKNNEKKVREKYAIK